MATMPALLSWDEALAACDPAGGANFVCSGTTTTTQSIATNNAAVTTQPGFNLNTAAGDGIAINAQGSLSYVDNNASSISSADNGLNIISSGAGGGVTIQTNGDISATRGIYAQTYSGAVNINAGGVVTGTGSLAIDALAGEASTALTIVAGTVNARTTGINADNAGTGSNSVTVTGPITAGSTGVVAINRYEPGDPIPPVNLTVSVADVSAGFNGIVAANGGTGATTVTATGNVTATTGDGIRATANVVATGGVQVDAVSVSAGERGIFVQNEGGGATGVTATGQVTGANGSGITALTSNTGTTLTIEAAGVSGGVHGIYAQNSGSGATSVTATGAVTATTANGIAGILAFNEATAAGLTVSAASASGTYYGIVAANNGTGATSVTATGDAQGGFAGIMAVNGQVAINDLLAGDPTSNGPGGTDLSVNATTATGGTAGIYAYNWGAGATNVSATGLVQGGTGGIVAINRETATSLTVNAAGVALFDGGGGITGIAGIYADNRGTGATSVTATGAVDAAAGIAGILAVNDVTATSLNVTATSATGGYYGIAAANAGTGPTSVTATGAAQGGYAGILAVNGQMSVNDLLSGDINPSGPGGTDLTVNATTTAGGFVGIYAYNWGTGATNVTATGVVQGGLGGIVAINQETATSLTVNAAGVALFDGGGGITGTAGIYADNRGTGATTVTATGAVNAVAGIAGILAVNDVTATSLNVDATSVTGGYYGIAAANAGTGPTSVTATGDAQGGYAGIVAINGQTSTNDLLTGNISPSGPGGTSLTVNATSSSGSVAGIYAFNWGTGATNITATGLAQGSVAGIGAINEVTATDLTVNAASAVGGDYGILAFNRGTGTTSITASGLVEGGIAAILATATGQPITITTNGYVRNASQRSTDLAIDASGGPVAFTNAGGMTGTVRFGAGAHAMANNAGWNTSGGTNEFGGGASLLTNGAGVAILAATDGGVVETTAFNGLANFSNHGMFIMADGGAGDRATTGGNLRFENGSLYTIDIDAAGQTDSITAAGTAVLQADSTLAVNVQGLLYGHRYTVLTANGGVTGEFGTLSGITNTAFLTVEDTYDATNAYLDVIKFRDFADAGLTRNQISTGRGLDSLAPGPVANAVANLMTDAQARAAFDQLSGEQHASMTSVLLDDSRFVRSSAIDRLRSSFGSVGSAPTPVMSYAPDGPVMVPATTDRLVVWGQAFGSWGNLNGDGNAAGVRRSSGGLTFGVDALVLDGWRIGLLGGYSNTSIGINGRNSSGRSDNYHIGAYAGSQWGNLSLRTGAAYTWHDISTSRLVAFPGFTDSLTASYGARTTQVFGDLGYRINMSNSVAIEPFGNLAYVNLHTEGFRETGGPAALTSKGVSTGVTFTTLGLRASSDFALGSTMATIRGSLGWRHAFGDITPMSTFAFGGGSAFGIAGVPIAQNAAVVEAGFDLRLFRNASFGIAYNGQFASSARNQSVKANLAVKF